MFRYLAVAWNDIDPHQLSTVRLIEEQIRFRLRDMQVVFRGQGLLVAVAGERPMSSQVYPLSPGRGVVLGKIFFRDLDARRVSRPVVLNDIISEQLLNSEGRRLVDEYWGRYVAWIHDPMRKTTWMLRDPSGGLPCFYTIHRDVVVSFSWMEDWCALGLQNFTVDWKHVAAYAAEQPCRRVRGRAAPAESQDRA